MRKKRHLVASLLTLLALAPGQATEPASATAVPVPEIVSGPEAQRMDAFLSRAAGLGFSGQVLVEREGRVVLHRAYGWADRARGRAMTTRTGLGIASISKHVTATAVLRLRDQGRLELDAAIGAYLPDVPPDRAGITVGQLLSHSGGLRGGDAAGDFELEAREQLLAAIHAEPLLSPPGERWEYANSGYSLLAAIVEARSGTTFEAYVKRELFDPAGMRDSGHWHTTDLPAERLAHAYMGWQDQGSPRDWPRNWRVYGSGDVVSTAADLYRFDLALRAHTILSKRGWREAASAHAEVSETVGYGYGLFVYRDKGRQVLEHGGDWQRGYNGLLMRYVDEQIVLIVTCNARDHHGNWLRQAVGAELERLARGGEPGTLPPAVEPWNAATRAALVGPYWLDDGARFEVVDDGATLWIGAVGQAAADALADVPDADRPALERGNHRTRRLLAALTRDEDGYAEALGTEVPAEVVDDYRSEWAGLTEAHGALVAFELPGSTAARETVVARAHLRFADGFRTYLQYFWSERAEGRLRGTYVRPGWFPAGIPQALPLVPAGGGLLAYDVYAESGVSVDVFRQDGAVVGLRVGTHPAFRSSPQAPIPWKRAEPFLKETGR